MPGKRIQDQLRMPTEKDALNCIHCQREWCTNAHEYAKAHGIKVYELRQLMKQQKKEVNNDTK